MIAGQVERRSSGYGTYKVYGGLGNGREVVFAELTNWNHAAVIVDALNAIRAYYSDAMREWLDASTR